MMMEQIKNWVQRIKADLVALYIATKDARTPMRARMIAILVVGYALSPIDLIPDFIPILGYLDDILIVPFGIMLAIHLIPAHLMDEYRCLAQAHGRLPKSLTSAIVVVCIWCGALIIFGWWLFNQLI